MLQNAEFSTRGAKGIKTPRYAVRYSGKKALLRSRESCNIAVQYCRNRARQTKAREMCASLSEKEKDPPMSALMDNRPTRRRNQQRASRGAVQW